VDISFYIQNYRCYNFSIRPTHFEFFVLLEKLGVAASFHFLLFGECNEAPDFRCLLVWIPETRFVFLLTARRSERPISKPQYLCSFVSSWSLACTHFVVSQLFTVCGVQFRWTTVQQINLEFSLIIFRRVHKIVKSDYYLHHVCPDVRPSVCMGTARFPPTDSYEI